MKNQVESGESVKPSGVESIGEGLQASCSGDLFEAVGYIFPK